MICPNCGEALREHERSGVEVDVCPACRGMWLDRGEFDRLIDRESRHYADDDDDWDNGDRRGRDGDSRGQRGQPPRGQQKKGFFQTLMENLGEGGE